MACWSNDGRQRIRERKARMDRDKWMKSEEKNDEEGKERGRG